MSVNKLEDLERRLEETEGVMFGLVQLVAVLINTHPTPDKLKAVAEEHRKHLPDMLLHMPTSDFSNRQTLDTFETLLRLPKQSPPSA
jgi:hypothetical protein